LSSGKPVRIKQLPVVSVSFGLVATFAEFFEDNMIDPNALDAAYNDQIPPSYAASYDPSNGAIVKQNTFVRNLANVLNIDPSRIKVTNIVPGNRRRRRLLEGTDADAEGVFRPHVDFRRVLMGTNATDDGGDDDEGLGVDFEISATDSCANVVCAHGDCDMDGLCDCEEGWAGATCNMTWVNCTALSEVERSTEVLCNDTSPTATPTLMPTTPMPTAAFINGSVNGSSYSASGSAYDELLSVASTLTDAAGSGALDTGYEVR